MVVEFNSLNLNAIIKCINISFHICTKCFETIFFFQNGASQYALHAVTLGGNFDWIIKQQQQ